MASSSRKYVCPKCFMSVRATREVRVRCDNCDQLMVYSPPWPSPVSAPASVPKKSSTRKAGH